MLTKTIALAWRITIPAGGHLPGAGILPNLVLFTVFVFGPVLFSFGMSFTNWDGFSSKWIGCGVSPGWMQMAWLAVSR